MNIADHLNQPEDRDIYGKDMPQCEAPAFDREELLRRDVLQVLRILPKDLKELIEADQVGSRRFYIAGGVVLSCVTGEKVNDIDVLCDSRATAKRSADILAAKWNSKPYGTRNAYTVRNPRGPDVQFIHRWCFENPASVIESFDFTVCQAVVYLVPKVDGGVIRKWEGTCGRSFYKDIAARRLVYTAPNRQEAAGGSMMRAFKYTRKGYYLDLPSLALLIHRVNNGVQRQRVTRDKEANIILALLEEVDPSMARLDNVVDPNLV